MEDAATLVALLEPLADTTRTHPDALSIAFVRYNELRRPRSQQVARRSRLTGTLAQSGGPVAARLQNMTISVIPQAGLR
ncbi:hypothetical protein [Microbacterium sp. MPKO10]|uniref:hypothetical protein n=1 Tax=Microbacterium sp. MPKO10 TaxID=2989818 RepID=UPI0022363FE7|nr:hypothetical protein [Microbacterium sp. MPKO10]MCW4458779.1 hypothetical protein [Microbacterium sp. MPKO10]